MTLKKSALVILLLAIALSSCQKPQPRTIYLQPFVDFSSEQTNTIQKELTKIYSDVKILPAIDFPKNSWNQTKTRRRADSLIAFLDDRAPKNGMIIGLTHKDISTTKGNYKDWGVMGLGYCPGKACIASTYRLSGKKKMEQLFKVAIHELGHTEGIPHCPEKSCFMRDAKGKNTKDEETGFCGNCKEKLVASGWLLK